MNAMPILNTLALKNAEPVKLNAKSDESKSTSFSQEFEKATQSKEAEPIEAKAEETVQEDSAVAEDNDTSMEAEDVAGQAEDVADVSDMDGDSEEELDVDNGLLMILPMNVIPGDTLVAEAGDVDNGQNPVFEAEKVEAEIGQLQNLGQEPEAIAKEEEAPAAQVFVRQVMQEVERAMQQKPQASNGQTQNVDEQLESDGQVAKVVMSSDGTEQTAMNADAEETLANQEKDVETTSSAQTDHPIETAHTKVFAEHMEEPADIQKGNVQEAKEAFFGKLVEQVRTAVSNEKQELFIQLKPEHLGGLAIALSMTEKGLTAKLATSSHEVQSMLNSDLVAMQEALREKGINVVQMEVIYDQSANMAGSSFSENGGRWFGSGQGGSGTFGNNDSAIMDVSELFVDYGNLLEPESSLEFNA